MHARSFAVGREHAIDRWRLKRLSFSPQKDSARMLSAACALSTFHMDVCGNRPQQTYGKQDQSPLLSLAENLDRNSVPVHRGRVLGECLQRQCAHLRGTHTCKPKHLCDQPVSPDAKALYELPHLSSRW